MQMEGTSGGLAGFGGGRDVGGEDFRVRQAQKLQPGLGDSLLSPLRNSL